VTGVDGTDKLELLRSLGADRVIDYMQADVTRGEERYDLILDVASTLSVSACKRILKPTGIYVLIGHDHYGWAGRRCSAAFRASSGSPRARSSIATCRRPSSPPRPSKRSWPS
jgi:NADPH:quinone reductase-like Zn-dependent oxidoreductase